MKKFFVITITAAFMAACNNTNTNTTVADTESQAVITDTTPVATTTDTMADVTYAPSEGDVIYRDGKVYIMKNGNWVEAHEDIQLDNGAVVSYKTHTVKKDDEVIELKEDEAVNKTGNFFDKSGRAIKTAWGQTKDAVEDAGSAVGKAAKKAGKKIDSAVNGEHK